MKKKDLFRTLNFADRHLVIELAGQISDKYDVAVLKQPQKTLVMLKMRESAQSSLFYAGEAVACECMVQIDEKKGFASSLGDDLEKVFAMAVIDAALNAKLSECGQISDALNAWEEELNSQRKLEAEITMSTKVNFNIMEE